MKTTIVQALFLLAASSGVRAALPPEVTTYNYSDCMVRCNQQYKDCMFECEAESMQWITVNMKSICKGVYMECIHECDKLLTIH